MMKKHKNYFGRNVNNSSGFSLLEVLLGITVFMIGMLGVTALNISSLKSNTFSGNLSEAVIIAGDKLEDILAMNYDDLVDGTDADGNGPTEDTDDDGIDDQLANGSNFGLDDIGSDADYSEEGIGRNNMYDVYWNVAEEEPMENTKKVNVIVRWQIKEVWRQINMSLVRVGEP